MDIKIPIKHLDRLLLIMALILVAVGIVVRLGTQKGQPGIETKPRTRTRTRTRTAVTLVFTQWWQDVLEKDTLAGLIKEFEKQNPGIHIRLDSRSYPEIQEKALKMAMAVVANNTGGSAEYQNPFPGTDILALDPRWLHELIQHEVLEPLTPYIENAEFTSGVYQENPATRYARWAIPLVSFMAPLFYNIAVLKAAGFDRPPKSRTDFLHYARTITAQNPNRFGMALSLDAANPEDMYLDVYSWVWASGAVMMKQGRPNITDRSIIETLEFLGTLWEEELLSPNSFSKTREQKLEEFCDGRIGMIIASVQDIDDIRERIGDTGFGITTIPVPDGYFGKPVFGLTSWYAGISRYSEHKEAAWAFIAFLAEQVSVLAVQTHGLPGIGNVPEDSLGDTPFYAKVYDMYEGGDTIQEFIGIPRVRELESIIWEELYTMLEEGRSARVTAEAMQRRWRDVLKN
ncbi:MAG: extracellular solute-binding protein [Treponema sp.]|jgi:multiple sugar transport system substrate-binding protein|nr:extracellular solute-binding protein [Treponema sp.]